jgi:hypothetical protein
MIKNCLICRVWETFLILLVVYSAWICPLEFAFMRYLPRAPFVVDDVVNAFFAVDIVLTFFVPFVDKKSYLVVDDPKKIALRCSYCSFRVQTVSFRQCSMHECSLSLVCRYLSTWFIFDVCSTVPFHSINHHFNKHGIGFRSLNVLRLWRLRRVSSLFARYVYLNLVKHCALQWSLV